ncbi:hypothetical protein N9I82_01870 [Alphaproteobacteria bacterium]|nr:hypothetical protein [Alphaproteobacteria bacterium]
MIIGMGSSAMILASFGILASFEILASGDASAGGWLADRDFSQNALVLMSYRKFPDFSGLVKYARSR